MEKPLAEENKTKPYSTNENFAELLEQSLKKETKK